MECRVISERRLRALFLLEHLDTKRHRVRTRRKDLDPVDVMVPHQHGHWSDVLPDGQGESKKRERGETNLVKSSALTVASKVLNRSSG